MNYFEFYSLAESFTIDKKVLRKAYLEKSREVHPDMLVADASKDQESGQDLATYNNEAYTVLSDDINLIKYMLQLHGIAVDAKSAALPADFLMEMMELNEAIEEVKGDNQAHLIEKVDLLQQAIEDAYLPILVTYSVDMPSNLKVVVLNQARDYFLKMNYIKRLRENLNGLGSF